MDVTKQIQSLIEALKADKSMAQPWKNYAISDASRLQAVIEKAKSVTNRTPPPEIASQARDPKCSCNPGQKADVNCPVHGLNI